MLEIKDTIVSEALLSRNFVCHLEKCKGSCCVQGDLGAPIDREELEILEKELSAIVPFMTPEFFEDIKVNGLAEPDGAEFSLRCQPTGECNFVVYENGIAGCAIEKAWKAGKTDFRKPVSCHLYPVRVNKYREFSAVNYHEWHICHPACSLGDELKVPVYVFLKEALIRKFGLDWYEELCAIASYLEKEQG